MANEFDMGNILTKMDATQFNALIAAIRSGGGGGGEGSTVSWEQIVTSGVQVGTITIDGLETAVFVPKQEDVYIENEQLIGTFLGKPLYRRCFIIPNSITIPSEAYDTLLNVNADYMLRLVKADIISGDDATPKVCNEFVVIYSKTYHTFRALSLRNNASGIAANSVLVCEYTKVGE